MTAMPVHPNDAAEQRRMRGPGLDVRHRPAPGLAKPAPAPVPDVDQEQPGDLARLLSSARAALAGAVEPMPEATGGWEYFRCAIGRCRACGEPCRSTDPDGRPLHPTCGSDDAER